MLNNLNGWVKTASVRKPLKCLCNEYFVFYSKELAESEDEILGACAAKTTVVKRTTGTVQRSTGTVQRTVLNKVSTRLSTNTKRRSSDRGAESKEKTLRIGADRNKSDSLRKGRKRRSNDRSLNSTLVGTLFFKKLYCNLRLTSTWKVFN